MKALDDCIKGFPTALDADTDVSIAKRRENQQEIQSKGRENQQEIQWEDGGRFPTAVNADAENVFYCSCG